MADVHTAYTIMVHHRKYGMLISCNSVTYFPCFISCPLSQKLPLRSSASG